jgi:hypothetical protein
LDAQLAGLAALEKDNSLTEVEWYAGPKLLVKLSFPKSVSEEEAEKTILLLQDSEAVEKVVAESASNLEFTPGDFINTYASSDLIPEATLRGFGCRPRGRGPLVRRPICED